MSAKGLGWLRWWWELGNRSEAARASSGRGLEQEQEDCSAVADCRFHVRVIPVSGMRGGDARNLSD